MGKEAFTVGTTTATESDPTAVTAWWSLGCLMVEWPRTGPGAPLVSEGTLPEGASPALHTHATLDDSFYILEGRMVLQCGEDISLGLRGTWVPFPRRVPHTFRVLDGPARILMVHGDESFFSVVREVGEPAPALRLPGPDRGPTAEALSRSLLSHGIDTVGPPMEEEEARSYLERLGGWPEPG